MKSEKEESDWQERSGGGEILIVEDALTAALLAAGAEWDTTCVSAADKKRAKQEHTRAWSMG